MSRGLLIVVALWTCWSPPALGWLGVLASAPWWLNAWRRRWPAALGLALLAAAGSIPASAVALDVDEGAVEIIGVVRQTPGERGPWLMVAGQRIELSEGHTAGLPEAGRIVRVIGRVSRRGHVMPVVCDDLGAAGAAHPASLDRLAINCRARLRTVVPRPQRGLVEALVLGERGNLPDPLRRAAIDSGTSHLLALSGLHVSIVASWCTRVLPVLALPARSGTGLALIAFVFIAGARSPLLRAALTWCVGAMARGLGRRSDSLDRLALAAIALASWSPGVTQQLGARLSFCAVAGLIAFGRMLPRTLRALAPVGAFVATAPLCVETFGVAQPWGVIWSWILAPLVAVVMALGLITLVTSHPWIDEWLSSALGLCSEALEAAFHFAAHYSPLPCHPSPLPVSGWLGSVLVVAALVALAPQRRSRWEDNT